jgi:hypothetical protein
VPARASLPAATPGSAENESSGLAALCFLIFIVVLITAIA